MADAGEERLHLLLGHRLGQVVDNEVGLGVVLATANRPRPPVLLCRVHAVGNHLLRGLQRAGWSGLGWGALTGR